MSDRKFKQGDHIISKPDADGDILRGVIGPYDEGGYEVHWEADELGILHNSKDFIEEGFELDEVSLARKIIDSYKCLD